MWKHLGFICSLFVQVKNIDFLVMMSFKTFFLQSLTSSWKSEPRWQTPYPRLLVETLARPSVPQATQEGRARKRSGRRMPSLPCRLSPADLCVWGTHRPCAPLL